MHAQHLAGGEAAAFDNPAIGRRYPAPDQRSNVVGDPVGDHHGIRIGERNCGEAGYMHPTA